MKDENISITEVSGHIRKMHREMKVFEKALEVAEALDESSKTLKEMQKEILSLEKDKVSLENELDEGERALEDALNAKSAAERDAADCLKKARSDIKGMHDKAKLESDKLVGEAAGRIATLQKEIKTLSTERNKALELKEAADKQLSIVQSQIKQTKEKFIESL